MVMIADVEYRTQTALKAAVDARLPVATTKIQPFPLDDFWKDYLSYSPSFADKADQLGADGLMVGYHLYMGTLQMVLYRSQTEYQSFSFRACCKNAFDPAYQGSVSQLLGTWKAAMRNAIRPQMEAYRRSVTSGNLVKCAETNQFIAPREAHIDHHPVPFDKLANDFLTALTNSQTPPTLQDIHRTHSADPMHYTIIDQEVAQLWADYHEANATYRAVKASVNLSKSKKWQ
jgi:hypothetical protein